MLDKIKKWFKERKKEMLRGYAISLQMHDEKQRKRKMKYTTPGTMRYGLINKQDPIDFMKDAYELRKQKRKEDKK